MKCSTFEKIEKLYQQHKLFKNRLVTLKIISSNSNGKNDIHHHGEKRNGEKWNQSKNYEIVLPSSMKTKQYAWLTFNNLSMGGKTFPRQPMNDLN